MQKKIFRTTSVNNNNIMIAEHKADKVDKYEPKKSDIDITTSSPSMKDLELEKDNTLLTKDNTYFTNVQKFRSNVDQFNMKAKDKGSPRHSSILSAMLDSLRSRSNVNAGLNETSSTVDNLSLLASYHSNSTKKNVYIKCVFINIEDINTIHETFSGVGFVRAAWREPKLEGHKRDASDVDWDMMWSPQLDISNVLGEAKLQVWKELKYSSNGQCFVVEKRRVRGTFTEPMQLEEFPFDVQRLSLLITSEISMDQVELHEDSSHFIKIETYLKKETQWKLMKFVHCEPKITKNEYSKEKYRKPGLFFRCCVIRNSGFFVYNIMLVMAIISALSFVTFSVDRNKPQNRLQLVFLLLIAGVAFKFAASQSVPQIPYLTNLDRYILGSMTFLFLVAIYHGSVSFMQDSDGTVDFRFFILFLVLFVLLHVGFVFRVVVRGYGRRKEVHEREREYLSKIKDSDSFHETFIPSARRMRRFSEILAK